MAEPPKKNWNSHDGLCRQAVCAHTTADQQTTRHSWAHYHGYTRSGNGALLFSAQPHGRTMRTDSDPSRVQTTPKQRCRVALPPSPRRSTPVPDECAGGVGRAGARGHQQRLSATAPAAKSASAIHGDHNATSSTAACSKGTAKRMRLVHDTSLTADYWCKAAPEARGSRVTRSPSCTPRPSLPSTTATRCSPSALTKVSFLMGGL